MLNFTPKSGGQFELESGGQFAPKLVVNLHWNRVVNLTGFSSKALRLKTEGTFRIFIFKDIRVLYLKQGLEEPI